METRRIDRARVDILVGAMVVAAVVCVVVPLVAIDEGGSSRELVTSVAENRGRFFATNLLFALFSALVGLSGIGFMLLARRRAAVLMTVGGTLMVVGGISLAAAVTTYSTVLYVSTDSAFGQARAIALSNIGQDNAVAALPWLLGGPVALVGVVLAGIALLLARTTPLWIPILWLVGIVVVLFGQTGIVATLLAIPFAVALVAVAVSLHRAMRPAAPAPAVPGQAPRHADEATRAEQPEI